MKQTSAALTFLMAQYRAIFKRAYIKGIASAVLLTAGLAAGAAQATNTSGITWGTTNDTQETITISGEATVDEGSKDYFVHNLTITSTGKFTVGSGSAGPRVVVNNNMTLQSGATLTVNNAGSGIQGSNKIEANNAPAFDTANTTFNATGSKITVKSGSSIQFVNTTIKNSTVTLESGAGIGAEDGTVTLAGDRGVLTLDGGTHTIVGSSYMYGSTVNVTKGTTITMGTASTDNKNSADLYASTNSGKSAGVLNLAGTVNVIQSGTALIGGSEVNLTGTINNSGDLILGNVGDGNVINIDGATITNEGKGYIWARADVVMTDGSIVLKDGEGMAGLDPSGDTFAFGSSTGVADFTATGGTIELADADIAMLDVTLGGDVEVTLTGAASGATWKDNSHIDAAVESTTNEGGTFTVKDNASIEMNDGSLLTAQIFNMDGGTITMQGSQTGNEDNASGTAMIRAFPDAIINLNAGEIDITASKAGVIRGEEINLKGTSIDNRGTLTIGGYLSNQSGANTVAAAGTFNMTGGSLTNAGILNLGVYNESTQVDNKDSVFTIAGGTFNNQSKGTVNVASGSTLAFEGTAATTKYTNNGTINVTSGAHFTTAGAFTLDGAGKIDFKQGATNINLAGEDVVLNNELVIGESVTANVVGKVTYNGDGLGSSGNKVDITGSGDVSIAGTGTLIIDDAANTIGLTYTAGADGALGTFSGDSSFAGIASGSTGILYLNVSGTGLSGTISNDDLDTFASNLKQVLTGNSGSSLTIKLDGVNFDYGDAIDETKNRADFEDVENALATGVSDGQLDNTSIAVSSSDSQVQGSIGQVALGDSAGSSVTVGTKTPLVLNGHEVNGQSQGTALVTVGSGDTATVGGAELQAGSNLNLAAANGTISDITATAPTGSSSAGTVAIAAGSSITVVDDSTTAASVRDGVADTVTRGDIGSTGAKVNTVNVAGALEAKDVYVTNLNLNSTDAKLVAESVDADTASITGSLKADEVTSSTAFDTVVGSTLEVTELTGAKVTLAGSTTAQTITASDTLTFGGDAQTKHAVEEVVAQGALAVDQATSVEAGSIEASQGLSVVGNATLTADSIELTQNGGALKVGSDANNGTGGTLSAVFLNLNGNDLIVDPAFGQDASIVAVEKISNSAQDTDAQINGSVYALRNSIIAIGTNDAQRVKDTFAPYLGYQGNANSLNPDQVGALVYIHTAQTVADGYKIVAQMSDTDSSLVTGNYAANAITLGNNSALAINVDAAKNGPALTFDTATATISATDTSKIVLAGDYASTDILNLFQDNGGDGINLATGTNSVRIETLNGLMYKNWTTTDGALDSINVATDLQLDTEKVKTAYTDASAPVRHSIIAYVAGDANWDGEHREQTHGALVAGASHDGTNYVDADGQALANQDRYILIDNPAYDAVDNPDVPQQLVYVKAENDFLTAVREQTETSGAAAESAARMADFAGVAQVALKAGASTYEAISGRMGMGAENTSMTFANNGQGAGIWLTPIYQTSDSDGFEAQGLDYGADIDLYGIALGGDYTLANGVRVGAMFNVGSGEADGQGAGSAVSNDFDYYGFGLYAGYTVGQFSVVGDVSYTAVDNDVEANTNIDKLETSLDSSNLSLGVTGAYAFETAAGIEVTPHVGLRYSYIDIDDYSVKGKTTGVVGDYSADSLSVFSIPVGVTIASEFQAGSWSVKPSFDITLTGNFGDDENEGTFHWAGVENIDSSLNSEIFDNFTYGASLGIAAQGLTVGYTGSSNVDDLGVSANARFTF